MTYLTETEGVAIVSLSLIKVSSMQSVLAVFGQIAPVLRRCQNGGWLAVAPDESPIHIGVFAWSADEARNRFDKARSEWCVLLEESPGTGGQ
jgi:hypothetical protein